MDVDIKRVLARIKDTDRVLDLGGWDKVFPRANVVVDLNPYETRRTIYPDIPERFSKDSWLIDDFCSPKFWSKIPDKAFDFITIGHTLEDIRDPLYVCSQMIRCGKAGYIESPSRFRECVKSSSQATFSGYDHHRWILEVMPDRTGIYFKAKLSWAHHEDFLGDEHRHLLERYDRHFNGFFWTGSFNYIELFPKGTRLETQELWHFYRWAKAEGELEYLFDLKPDSTHADNGKCLWVDQYQLRVEVDAPWDCAAGTEPKPAERQRPQRRWLKAIAGRLNRIADAA